MDPFISGLLLSIVTNLATGPINVYDWPKNLINKFKADPKPINHDLQKAIKIAYLQALLEIAQEFKAGIIQPFRLYLPTELDQKIEQWQNELKQVKKAKDETEISSPLQDTAEIEQLLLSHGKPIGDRLQELETRLISQALQGISDLPTDYQNQVQTGLFSRIYAHFVEQLKTNDRAYRAFELEYLPTINAGLTEIGVGQEKVALTMTDMFSVVNRTDQNVQKLIDIFNPKSLTLEDWQEICRQNLTQQKQLTTNPFTNAYGVTPQLDNIYVPLAIVESKPPKPPSRNQPEEKEEEKLIPIAEECFFEDVLRQGKSQISQGRKIAIIGEPGSGKTTRLRKIADWILEQDLGLPIWISLADLTQPTITQYIAILFELCSKLLIKREHRIWERRIWGNTSGCFMSVLKCYNLFRIAILYKAIYTSNKIKIIEPKITDFIISLVMVNSDYNIRLAAVHSLNEIGKYLPTAIDKLVNWLVSLSDPRHGRTASMECVWYLCLLGKSDLISSDFVLRASSFAFNKNYFKVSWDISTYIDNIHKQTLSNALVEFINNYFSSDLYWEDEICEAAWCLWQVDKSNLLVTDVLIKIINKSSKEWVRSKAAEILGLIEPENLLARQTLVQILRNYENKDSSLKVLKSLSMIDYYNEITVEDLLKLIKIKDSDLFYREDISEILERISLVKFEEKQRSEIIYQLSLHLSDTEQKYVLKYGACRSLLWNCAQSMIYSDFYKSWYHQKVSPFPKAIHPILSILNWIQSKTLGT